MIIIAYCHKVVRETQDKIREDTVGEFERLSICHPVSSMRFVAAKLPFFGARTTNIHCVVKVAICFELLSPVLK